METAIDLLYLLCPEKHTQNTGQPQAQLTSHGSAFSFIDEQAIRFHLKGKRDGFGFSFVMFNYQQTD